jgi:hypothetical protein
MHDTKTSSPSESTTPRRTGSSRGRSQSSSSATRRPRPSSGT